MTWATEDALEHTLEVLAERYSGEKIEILDTFDIAQVGWECDSRGALIVHNGKPELVILDQVGGDDRTVGKILLEKVAEYRRLIVDTERVFARYFQLRASRGDPEKAMEILRRFSGFDDALEIDGQEYVLQRAPGESDEEYEDRKSLFDDLKKSGGRLSVRVEDLPESVIDRLQQVADEYPDAEIEGTGDLVTDLGLPEITRTLWALVRALNACLEDMGMTPAEFAHDVGVSKREMEKICDGVVDPQNIARLIEIYDIAAEKSNRRMLREMIDAEIEIVDGREDDD